MPSIGPTPHGPDAGQPAFWDQVEIVNLLVMNWLDRENARAGGAEIHLHEIFGRLVERGHRVTLVCSGWTGGATRATLDGIDVIRVGGRYTYPFLAPRIARSVRSRTSADLLVEDLNKAPLFSPLWAEGSSLLLVHHLFGKTAFGSAALPVSIASWVLEQPLSVIYAGIPVVAVSESTRQDLICRGFHSDRVEVIENGVDASRYIPDPEAGRFETPTILYLGRLKRYKRVDLIIDAVATMKNQGIPVTFLVAGEGDDRPRLERHARRLGLGQDTLRFLGFATEAEKIILLQRAWVHVLTSSREGWGISNLEASACGTPIVASDSPGLRDSVREGQTGFLVPHGDVDALARRLWQLLSDSTLRERMGMVGREFALALSWDRAADRLERSIRTAVAPVSPGA
jgi:glycosyltransferase involved in cell wall biosynthesis